jgi:hypothetical protein
VLAVTAAIGASLLLGGTTADAAAGQPQSKKSHASMVVRATFVLSMISTAKSAATASIIR